MINDSNISKTVENHDVIASTQMAKDPEWGSYPDYDMSSLKVYSNSINVASYYYNTSLGPLNNNYLLPDADHYYIVGGITDGTSMGYSTPGKVTIFFTIFANDFLITDKNYTMSVTF